MTLELFHNDKSTCSQKVRLCLGELDVAWIDRHIDLAREENLTPAFLAINPNGVVPAIRHDGHVLIESTVICEYLCEVFPDPQHLLPATAVGRARMRAWLRYIDEVPSMAVRVPTYQLIRQARFGGMSEADFADFARRNPLRRDFFERLGTGGFSERDQASADKQLRQTVARMEQALSVGEGLCGDLTIADLCAVPVFQRLVDIGQAHYWQDAPNVSRWFDGLRARPSWKLAFYLGALMTDEPKQRLSGFSREA